MTTGKSGGWTSISRPSIGRQFWNDAGYLILNGAHYGSAPIRWEYGNPLGGRLGFTGDNYGYVPTQLAVPAAQAVQFRFRPGSVSTATASSTCCGTTRRRGISTCGSRTGSR